MAKSTRKSKATNTPPPTPNPTTPTANLSSKDKWRIGIGLTLFVLGCFLTLSIIGYIFSWKKDQDLLISSKSIFDFLFNTTAPIDNFCGRLGAAAAHGLVYNGIGLPVLLITIWVTGVGYNLLVRKKVFLFSNWINYIALGFLFLSPILAFAFRSSAFPFGGAFGNTLIDWTSGFAGNIGVILMMLLMMCFFYFLVFQLKVQPIKNAIGSLFPEKKETTPTEEDNFKGFSNPSISSDEQAAKMELAAQQGYQYNNNEEEPVFTEDDGEESLLHVLNDEEEEDGSTDFIVHNSHEPIVSNNHLEPEMMPTLVIKPKAEENEATNAKKQVEAAPELVLNNVPEMPELDIKENKEAETIILNTTIDNGIVLEIPELVAQETLEKAEELVVIEAPQEITEEVANINIPAKEDDLALAINEPIAEETTLGNHHGAHFGIDTPYQPGLELSSYQFPPLDLLQELNQSDISVDREELENNKNQIVNTLRSFSIEIQRISATVGPTVTLYEIVPAEGVRISKIKNLEDDIALNLAALGIRIIAPIPGRGTIGIEVPNRNKQMVSMRSILASEKFQKTEMSLPVALGKKIDNENYIVDLATMPHLLMAGATGQGKSVGINAILVSLLYKKHPSELKFVMVDPKKVELSIYRLIEKHYLAMLPNEEEPIITDTKKVVNTLNALCIEMDNRYELLKDAGARNIKEYNEKFKNRKLNPQNGHKYLPFIVLVIDEFADLIMTAGKEVEMPIARLAQLARAIGIHIIIATQRPSVNVITGIIKANFPARIAFRVSAKVDSRTILDASGADQLIGRGDMLVSIGSDLLRVQCAFVDTPEVERIVAFIGEQKGFPTAFLLPEYEGAENEGINKEDIDLSKRDKMFEEAARLVVSSQSGSTSMLQRKFNLGYNRAGRIMDQLEAANIVGPAQGSKPREVLIHTEYELENLLETLF